MRGGYFPNSRGNPPKRNEFPSNRGVYSLQVGSDDYAPHGNGNGSHSTGGSHGIYRGEYGPARGESFSKRGGFISDRGGNASFGTNGPPPHAPNENGLVSGAGFNPPSRSTYVPTRGGYAPMRAGYFQGRAGNSNMRGLSTSRGGQVPDERSFRYNDQFRKQHTNETGNEKRPNEPGGPRIGEGFPTSQGPGYPERGNDGYSANSVGYSGKQYMDIDTDTGSSSSRPRRFNNYDPTPKQSNKENTPQYNEISAKNDERLNGSATKDYPYSGLEMF